MCHVLTETRQSQYLAYKVAFYYFTKYKVKVSCEECNKHNNNKEPPATCHDY